MAKPFKVFGAKTSNAEHIGDCVYCRHGIFSDQDHGRAVRPLIGKAHTGCIPKPAPKPEPGPAFNSDVDLTRRELEILQLVGCGLNVAQIAKRLWLSPRTVETHMDHARAKLRVHTGKDAARVALDSGLIPVLTVERFPTLAELVEERFGGAPS